MPTAAQSCRDTEVSGAFLTQVYGAGTWYTQQVSRVADVPDLGVAHAVAL